LATDHEAVARAESHAMSDIDMANIASTRALLMDAYGACANTAEAMGAAEAAAKIRELAFTITGAVIGPGRTQWSLPSAKRSPAGE
jgi:hypothetical protein